MEDQDTKAVHVIVEPAPISAGVDNASLWTLMAVIFFGIIIFFFVAFRNAAPLPDNNIDLQTNPMNLDNAVEMRDADNDGIIDMGTVPLNGVVDETPTSS
jgi:hypothetical protein